MKFSEHTHLLSEPGAKQGCPEGRAPAPGQGAQRGRAPCSLDPALTRKGSREAKGQDFSRNATWNVNTGIQADAGV